MPSSWAKTANFKLAINPFLFVIQGQFTILGGPTEPFPIQSNILLDSTGVAINVGGSKNFIDANDNNIGTGSYDQQISFGGSGSGNVTWTETMTFASEGAAGNWQPFAGAETLTLSCTMSQPNPGSGSNSATFSIDSNLYLTDPTNNIVIQFDVSKTLKVSWSTTAGGGIYDSNGVLITPVPATTGVTFTATVDMIAGQITVCGITWV